MCLAVAGAILYRHLHSSRSVEFHSKVPPAEVSPEIRPSTVQRPETLPPEVSPTPVAKAALPFTDLGEKLARDQEATIPYEEKGKLPPNRVDISDNVIEAIETPSQTSAPTPDLASMSSIPPAITKRMPVGHGGGRPRGGLQGEESEQPKSSQRKPRALKPEVVCWYEERKWFVGLETPEEFQEYFGLTVTQDGIPLTQDDKDRWALIKADGKISVSWAKVEQPIEIDLNNKPYLLFRLAGQSIRRGRLIRYATVGWFLVIVPDRWQRDEEVSGIASIFPEPVFIAGYQAHYFSLSREDNRKIAFSIPQGESVSVSTRASRFELVGTRLIDASDDIGPLFGEGPPRIRTLELNGWSSIKTIVIGQEGPGRNRWRTDFSPNPDQTEQDLPDELFKRAGGWYFIRVYDSENGPPAESMDFRFMNALKNISIAHHLALPEFAGHIPVQIEFVHDAGCVVNLKEGFEDVLRVQRTMEQTIVTIPADPVWDKTRWSVNLGNRVVEADIIVERLWWAIGDEIVANVQPYWTDKPLMVLHNVFTATSKSFLWLRLPKPKWVDEVRLGFNERRASSFPVKVGERKVGIRLGNLEGAQELENRTEEQYLKLWVTINDIELSTTIAKVLSEEHISPKNIEIDISQIQVLDLLNTPMDRKCCSTCGFANHNERGIRCSVGTWEEMVGEDLFYQKYATYICSRWQGEYYDVDGKPVTP